MTGIWIPAEVHETGATEFRQSWRKQTQHLRPISTSDFLHWLADHHDDEDNRLVATFYVEVSRQSREENDWILIETDPAWDEGDNNIRVQLAHFEIEPMPAYAEANINTD